MDSAAGVDIVTSADDLNAMTFVFTNSPTATESQPQQHQYDYTQSTYLELPTTAASSSLTPPPPYSADGGYLSCDPSSPPAVTPLTADGYGFMSFPTPAESNLHQTSAHPDLDSGNDSDPDYEPDIKPAASASGKIHKRRLNRRVSSSAASDAGSTDSYSGGKERKPIPKAKITHWLLKVLRSPDHNPSVIRWENEETGEFRVVDQAELGRMWGVAKGNPQMDYEKFR